MRKRELDRKLKDLGWRFKGHGRGHDLWTNDRITVPLPCHREINERIDKKILKEAKQAEADHHQQK